MFYALTSEERTQIIRGCAKVTEAEFNLGRAEYKNDPAETGLARSRVLSAIGQLSAIFDAIEAKQEGDGNGEEPPF